MAKNAKVTEDKAIRAPRTKGKAEPTKAAPAKRKATFRAKRGETLLRSPGGQVLAKTFALPVTATAAPVYPPADRYRLLDQLTLALDSFYVHLPRKKAIYGFDSIRALGLLRLRAEALSDPEFHENLVEIIARVRDRHVSFYGRSPYGRGAVLPFVIETCWDTGSQIYVVTKLVAGTPVKTLQPGARVTHWNGIPIDRYIRLNANMFDSGNEASSLARSLAFLRYRPLAQFGPPLEEWVDLRFTLNGADLEERFTWLGFDSANAPAYPALGRKSDRLWRRPSSHGPPGSAPRAGRAALLRRRAASAGSSAAWRARDPRQGTGRRLRLWQR